MTKGTEKCVINIKLINLSFKLKSIKIAWKKI